MNKVYTRINWENYPSTNTPLNESNLNKLDFATNEIDNRLIEMDTTKVGLSELSNNVKDWTMDETTGVITITKYSGEKITFDLNIEKIPVSFVLDSDGILYMTTSDGTVFTANIGSMIPVLTFTDSDTIAVTSSGEGATKSYSFSIKNGSVTEDMLQPDYLADIKVETATSTKNATDSETNAKLSKSYAVGTGGEVRPDDATENAKYYYEQTKAISGGDFVPNSEKGQAGGVATLGSDGKVPDSQLPSLDYIPTSEKGVADGVASLGTDGKVPESQLPTIATDAEHITYDNTISELEAENVQSAIDELKEDLGSVEKRITTNLLKCHLQSQTVNGIQIVNNGDGTYTLNGTASARTGIELTGYFNLKAGTYKIIGTENTTDGVHTQLISSDGLTQFHDDVSPIGTASSDISCHVRILIDDGTVCNNVVVKPMLTTNLEANYSSFVSYTGDSGTINGDVAELQKAREWELIGSVTGANSVAIDSTKYSEFLVEQQYSTNSIISHIIPSVTLKSTAQPYVGGGYANSFNMSVYLQASKTQINNLSSIWNSVEHIAETTMTVYGKR